MFLFSTLALASNFEPGGVVSAHVVGEELQLLYCLAVLGVFLAVDDETLGNLVISLAHQGLLYFVLDVLDLNVVVNVEVGEDF